MSHTDSHKIYLYAWCRKIRTLLHEDVYFHRALLTGEGGGNASDSVDFRHWLFIKEQQTSHTLLFNFKSFKLAFPAVAIAIKLKSQ